MATAWCFNIYCSAVSHKERAIYRYNNAALYFGILYPDYASDVEGT